MNANDWEVVFSGEVAEGHDRAEVIANLARLFRTGEDRIARLFSGGEFVLKSRLDEDTARRYRATVQKAGALCRVRRRAAADTAAPPAPGPEAGAGREKPGGGPAWTVDPPGVVILEPREKPVREVDTSGLSLAPPGANILEATDKASPPPPDTSHLSLAPPGADILGGDEDD